MDGNTINSNHPPGDATIDAIDLLSQFPTENTRVPVSHTRPDLASTTRLLTTDHIVSVSNETDAISLLIFASERAIDMARAATPPPAHRSPLRAAFSYAGFVSRVHDAARRLHGHGARLFAAGAAAWQRACVLRARAAHAIRLSLAGIRRRQRVIVATGAARLRLLGMLAIVCCVLAASVLRLFAQRTVHGSIAAGQRGRIETARRFRTAGAWLAGVMSMCRDRIGTASRPHRVHPGGRALALPSLRRAYPLGLFLSGVAAGALLVTFSRTLPPGTAAPPVQARGMPATSAERLEPAQGMVVALPEPSAQPVPTSGMNLSAIRNPVPAPVPMESARSRPAGFRGSFAITSRPEGAAVFMNGRLMGTTPLELQNLPVGSRAVRVTLEGYDTWSRAVEVVTDRRTTIVASLESSRR